MTKFKWTASAVDCYKIKSNCARCPVKDIMEEPCHMDEIVLETFNRLGPPLEELPAEQQPLTPQQAEVLNFIVRNPGCTTVHVKEAFNLKTSTANYFCDTLASKRHVRKESCDQTYKNGKGKCYTWHPNALVASS